MKEGVIIEGARLTQSMRLDIKWANYLFIQEICELWVSLKLLIRAV
jgi:hypothetical protein